VPPAVGGDHFSVRRSNTKPEAKVLTDTTEKTILRFVADKLGDLAWRQSGIGAKEVRGETSDVGGGHGGSRDGFGLSIVPSGSDIQAGSPDMDGGTPIGEIGLAIVESSSGDGDCFSNAGGGVVARVFVVVSGGNDDGNTAIVELKMESDVSCRCRTPSTRSIPL